MVFRSPGWRVVAAAVIGFSTAAACASAAPVRAIDDAATAVVLTSPARRIVSLAPHTTELLFSAGAGSRVVATVEYSDYPAAAKAIPRVGGSSGLDLERIVAFNPDLIVGWVSGNPSRAIERLRALGFPVYLTQPRYLADIARHLEDLGRLAGTETIARAAARRFTEQYRALTERYAARTKLRVFYQVLDASLITVNGQHLISEILSVCGGDNIFADLPVIAPVVAEESVLNADPEAIVAGGTPALWSLWQTHWRTRRDLTAVKHGALYFIPEDAVHRNSVRVLDGIEQVCAALEDARRKR